MNIILSFLLLSASNAWALDEDTKAWLADLSGASQGEAVFQTLETKEDYINLLSLKDEKNPLFESDSAKTLIDNIDAGKINTKQSAKIAESKISMDPTYIKMKEDYVKGPKFFIDDNDPLLQHAKKVQKNVQNNDAPLLLDKITTKEVACEESVHRFTHVDTEKLTIQLSEPIEKTQDVILYASAKNEYSCRIFANLLTGQISTEGNGDNVLHGNSKVISPIGALPTGATVTLTRVKPFEYWNSITTDIEPSFGAEPSAANGYQYYFGIAQHHCNKHHKNLCHQYRGMAHHWSAHIKIPAKITSETWMREPTIVQLEKKGLCKKVSSRCVEGPQTRIFRHGGTEKPLTRECWAKETTYECTLQKKNANRCQQYRDKGCVQTSSYCKQMKANICVLYEQKFKCPENRETITLENKPYDEAALSKGAYTLPFGPNNDIGECLGGLALMQGIAKEQVAADSMNGHIFKGEAEECEALPNQCCAQRGIIKKMLGCSDSEKHLVDKVNNGFCHFVGETKEGLFHKKSRYYCCFNSKLAKVAQIGARLQLGLNFGEPKAQECRALTVSELEKVDWSQVDFSEVIDEMAAKSGDKLTDAAKKKCYQSIRTTPSRWRSAIKTNVRKSTMEKRSR